MTKYLAAAFVIAITAMTFSTSADAAYGCGVGWHPNRWGHCVRNYYAPAPRPGIVVAAPGIGVVVGAPVHRGCGWGWHWSNRWGHCVRN